MVALNFRTPRQAAQGDVVDAFRVEVLLRRREYQAVRSRRAAWSIDVAWLRAGLGRDPG